jgi:FkbM family methyltransferase
MNFRLECGFFSQTGQDIWALVTAKHKYYVDIGAGDGIVDNNTLKLEMDGWNGICVEPVLEEYEKLCKHRKCIKVNKAIWKENTKVDFMVNTNGQALSGIPGYFDNIHYRDGPHHLADAITLNQLLVDCNAPTEMGYLSIDTEGTEYEILQAFDFSYTFDCITVEHSYNEVKKNKTRELLISNGYKLHKEFMQDDYFVLGIF